MASVFGAKDDIEADLKTLGSGEAISLPLSALWTTGGGRGGVKVERRHGARFLGLMTRSEIGFAEGSTWDEQEARLMLSPQ